MLAIRNISKQYYSPANGENIVLKNVNFEVNQGDIVGILGNNGSGKSTLLKIISGLVAPTKGQIEYTGTISSLLEIGGGIEPSLSGLENYFLKGQLIGIDKKQLNHRLPELESFTELGNRLKEPVKHYSNGMYMRLALGIGLMLNADIYLFDEVLSVGDAAFQQKCMKTIRKLAESGSSIVMVSHNLNELDMYCNRFIWLNNGEIVENTVDSGVLSRYISASLVHTEVEENSLYSDQFLDILEIKLSDENQSDPPILNSQELNIEIGLRIKVSTDDFVLTLNVHDYSSITLFSVCSLSNAEIKTSQEAGIIRLKATIPSWYLNPSFYSLSLFIEVNQNLIQLRNLKGFQIKSDPGDKTSRYFRGKIRPGIQFSLI